MSHLVSVIVPCYNQAQYLSETLQSVLDQTYTNWECIIVNDGSTDHTEAVALVWCEKDSRFRYLYKKNGGLSSARNAGIAVSKGKYLQFLDSDDLIKSNKFKLQLIDLDVADVSICDYFPFKDGTQEMVKHRYLSPFLSENNFKNEIINDWECRKSIPCHSVLFKKEIIETNNIRFDESLPNHEDWVFWVMLLYYSDIVKFNLQVLALYRIRDNSMSIDYKLMRFGFLKAALKLELFFQSQQNLEFKELVKNKYIEIYNTNKIPILKSLKLKIYLLRFYCIKYVRKN